MNARTGQIENLAATRAELRSMADPDDAAFLQRFFKTSPGEYAEGDRVLGIYKRMPRTMLRYAIERFPEDLRQAYLNDRV